MEEPTTKPSGSNPASPSSTYSDTDRSEVKTPAGLAPAVFASRLSATCGSHTPAPWFCWFENSGIATSRALTCDHRSLVLELGQHLNLASATPVTGAGRPH